MSIRSEKVSSMIKHEIGAIISRDYSSKEFGFITVTEVQMTPDLKIAKIYVSIFEKPEIRIKTLKMLENNSKNIRTTLASHIRLKYTPALQFYIDETLDRAEHINNIIKKIHEHDKSVGTE